MEAVWVGQCALYPFQPCTLHPQCARLHSQAEEWDGITGATMPPFLCGMGEYPEQRGFLSHEDLRLLDRGQEYEIAYFFTRYNFAKCRRVSQVVILTV